MAGCGAGAGSRAAGKAIVQSVPGLRRILTDGESKVDRVLDEYARENGYRLLLKPRFRDVIDVDDMHLTGRERNFTFTAHFDFIAADAATSLPILAIEYDDARHRTDPEQRERDKIKDRLCQAAGLPMLRVDSQFARREGRWRVLGYILEMHEVGKAFHAAQQAGQVPWDEPFIHNLIIDMSNSSRPTFTGLDQAALERLSDLRGAGTIGPYGGWWRDVDGQIEACCVLDLLNGQFISSLVSIRKFAIEGISARAVADELATAELGWLMQRYEAGEPVALSAQQGNALLDRLGRDIRRAWSPEGWMMRWGSMPSSET